MTLYDTIRAIKRFAVPEGLEEYFLKKEWDSSIKWALWRAVEDWRRRVSLLEEVVVGGKLSLKEVVAPIVAVNKRRRFWHLFFGGDPLREIGSHRRTEMAENLNGLREVLGVPSMLVEPFPIWRNWAKFLVFWVVLCLVILVLSIVFGMGFASAPSLWDYLASASLSNFLVLTVAEFAVAFFLLLLLIFPVGEFMGIHREAKQLEEQATYLDEAIEEAYQE